MSKLAEKILKVTNIYLRIREDNKAGLEFELEDGRKVSLVYKDEYGEITPLSILEL